MNSVRDDFSTHFDKLVNLFEFSANCIAKSTIGFTDMYNQPSVQLVSQTIGFTDTLFTVVSKEDRSLFTVCAFVVNTYYEFASPFNGNSISAVFRKSNLSSGPKFFIFRLSFLITL